MTASTGAPSAGAAGPRARWSDTLAVLALAVAAATVLASAASSVGRMVGASMGGDELRDLTRAPRAVGSLGPLGLGDEEASPLASGALGERTLELGSPGPLTRGARVGVAAKGVKLLLSPSADAAATGAVEAGAVVVIAKEQGEWLLVLHSEGDELAMGWARKSDVTIR